jgi:NitT/TauT family transport system ATP-binding protein
MNNLVADKNGNFFSKDKNLVELDKVGKIFPARRKGTDDVVALRETTQSIRRGEIVTIVGPSGCGKTTLLSLMAGLEKPSSGKVSINGLEVSGPYTNSGIVFQKDLLLSWRNVMDNVLIQAEARSLPPESYRQRAQDLLDLVGLNGFENFYPHELSGGMRQRVSICRALLHDPELVLMDEPFAALDAITRDQLAVDFDKFVQAGDRTVIFITHNMEEAVFLGDRVMVMTPRPGQIAEVIDIDLPRPRTLSLKDSSEFTKYTSKVRSLFMEHGVLKDHL